MSVISIRAALETALAAIEPAIDTDYENNGYIVKPGIPYQIVNLLFGEPENPEISKKFVQEKGVFQVTLRYPLSTGSADAAERAELIKTMFEAPATFTAGGISVTVERTPWVGPGSRDGDRWQVPVRIRFYSNISN